MIARRARVWIGVGVVIAAATGSWSGLAADRALDGGLVHGPASVHTAPSTSSGTLRPRLKASTPTPSAARQTWTDLDPATRAGILDARRLARPADHPRALLFSNPEERLTATIASDGTTISGRDGAAVRFSGARLGRAGSMAAMSAGDVRGVGTATASIPRVAGDIAVTEWWTNAAGGIEQGFTLASRPTGAGPIDIEQRWTSDLRAVVTDDGAAVEFADASGTRLGFSGVRAWDATGRDLPARMLVDDRRRQLTLRVDDADAIYPVTIDPTWQQRAYLKASNTNAGDVFGGAVAISGDTVVIGAYGEDSNATGVNGSQTDNSLPNSGAAYVFQRSGATWTQQAYLKASNTGAGDGFGSAVGISGDTILVGAYGEASNATGVNGNQADNTATNAGAAYVFVRSGGTWTQQAYLKASNTGAGDSFGLSAAVAGDTLVVGAQNEDSNATTVGGDGSNNGATGAGAAYVFVRAGGTWTQQAYLKASNTDAFDAFGCSVAVAGDTVVVGAYTEDSSATVVNGNGIDNTATNAGAAYVFVRVGTAWTQQAYLKASNTETSDFFGASVSLSGDTVVVGAPNEDSNATGVNGNQGNNTASTSGAAYVFVRNGTTWTQEAYLKASNTGAGDAFGVRATISANTIVVGANGEGSNAVGVGGNQADNSLAESGAAYVFLRAGTTWTQQAYVKASNTGAQDWFQNVAISGNTLVVGALAESSNSTSVNSGQTDNSAADAGAAYVYRLDALPAVDVNGDLSGDAFLYNTTGGNWAVQNTTAGGAFTTSTGAWSPGWTVTPARFNPDAFTDFFLFNTSTGQWFTMINNGANDFTAQVFAAWATNWQRFVLDLDGDGLTDVFLWDPALGEWFQCLSNGAGNFNYVHGFWSPGWEVYPAQFNGDGRQDFFLFNRSSGQWFQVLGAAGATFTYPQSGFWSTEWVIYPGDYNGGGITDLLLFRPSSGFWFVATTGDIFTFTSGFFTPGYAIYPTDLDADGRSDLFLHNPSTGQWFDLIANGSGGFTNAGGSLWSLGWSVFPTDLNADGRGDMLLYDPNSGVWFQARNLTTGTFSYTSGFWNTGLTITASAPFSGN